MKPGKCYDNCLVALFERDFSGHTDIRLVHGYPRLQKEDRGHPAGTRYGHAWIECNLAGVVPMCFNIYDPDLIFPKFIYYAAGEIEEAYVRRYTRQEATKMMAATGTTGPWAEECDMPPGTVFAP